MPPIGGTPHMAKHASNLSPNGRLFVAKVSCHCGHRHFSTWSPTAGDTFGATQGCNIGPQQFMGQYLEAQGLSKQTNQPKPHDNPSCPENYLS